MYILSCTFIKSANAARSLHLEICQKPVGLRGRKVKNSPPDSEVLTSLDLEKDVIVSYNGLQNL